ncbi:hypothetical protein O6H91_14G035900 [Diphasiastrum complanatum]|uniref:Uncharacterized protein n=1 Tax=Diphasiastrum complanatum TaxID=34168 RepID=A0ACC2BN69_DIPCM|nr:hypothetical protein O6H91_Y005700 [Diphasiastrum complanatum]KAJ7531196.1 hypothetical protein O6H91_14G035900 [Diphasiastrum complanatum]
MAASEVISPARLTPNILKGHLMGVGTWAWGERNVWGYESYDASFNEASTKEAFHRSVELGVRLIDTASVYGNGESERLIGRFLKTLSPEQHENVVIATKYRPMPWHFNCRQQLLKSIKESLERLNVEKVGLLQVHGPALSIRSIEHLCDGLADAYEAGFCTSVGVSNFSAKELRRAHSALKKRNISLSSNQIELSLLRLKPELDGLLATCKELDVSILAYSPLAMGRLTGKYSTSNPPPKGRSFGNVRMDEIEPLLEKMKAIALQHGKTVAQVALNWCICKGAIPIPGAKNAKQAEDNAGALGWMLTPEDIQQLDALGRKGHNTIYWQHG